MDDAKALLLKVLHSIPDSQSFAKLFDNAGILEIPFLHSVGIEWRYEGRTAIASYMDQVGRTYPGISVDPEDIHILIETPEQVFAEYTADGTASATGRRIHHMVAARLAAKDGRIMLLRESVNVVASAQAVFPNGAHDLPAPGENVQAAPTSYRSQ